MKLPKWWPVSAKRHRKQVSKLKTKINHQHDRIQVFIKSEREREKRNERYRAMYLKEFKDNCLMLGDLLDRVEGYIFKIQVQRSGKCGRMFVITTQISEDFVFSLLSRGCREDIEMVADDMGRRVAYELKSTSFAGVPEKPRQEENWTRLPKMP